MIIDMIKTFVKDKKSLIFLGFLFAVLISTIYGISDMDFVWQTYLGKIILTEHRFNGLDDLVWGTKGLAAYYDHEWLTNVLFYLLSIPFGRIGSIIAFKLLIEINFCVAIYLLIKNKIKTFDNFSYTVYLFLLVNLFIFAQILIKPKAYNISMLFYIYTLLLLECYRNKEISFKKFTILTLVLVVLWNNFHSGSILFIVVPYFLYWVCYWKDIKTVLLGLVSLIALLVNPFGYKLILFDLSHFFDKNMKLVNKDWRGLTLDIWTGYYILLLFMFIIFLLWKYGKKIDIVYVLLFFVTMFLTVSSFRHFIYLFPVIVLIIIQCDIQDLLKLKGNPFQVFTLLVVMISSFFLVLFFTNFESIKRTFVNNSFSDELNDLLVQTNTNGEGLCALDIDAELWDLGLKSFTTGMFPQTRQRKMDSIILEDASSAKIEYYIDYYGFDKFLFFYSINDDTGYWRSANIYDYFKNNDDYVILYQSDVLVYVVHKDVISDKNISPVYKVNPDIIHYLSDYVYKETL